MVGEGLVSGATPPLMSSQSSQKKSCVEEAELEPGGPEGDGDKKGGAEGSSDEEGKLVIDEPAKEKNEKGVLKRRAGDMLEVTVRMCLQHFLGIQLKSGAQVFWVAEGSWTVGSTLERGPEEGCRHREINCL